MTGTMILILIILCEIWGLSGIKGVSFLKSFIYYTQLSNLAALISSLLLLVSGPQEWIVAFRFLSVCMLIMTLIVTVTILLPLLKDIRMLLWSRTGFFLHVVGPLLNTVSYFLFEKHASTEMLFIPPLVTLVYGVIMLYCNYIGKVDGPYPFLRIRNQTKTATVLWILLLLTAVSAISFLVYLPGR